MSRFIICRASAGSGKTYTLVRQYIETAISSPSQLEHRFAHILAITFTNKAANGMKERILSQLKAIASLQAVELANSGTPIPLVNEMAAHLGISADEVVRRCAVLHSAILHHYSDFAVCTIDSFVHRLVRTFAHDLRLPMNFNVMIDNQEIIKKSVDDLLSQAGQEGQESLTQVLCAFTENSMEEGRSYRIERQISELAAEIFKEETPQFLAQLKSVDFKDFIAIHHKLQADNRAFERQLAEAARVAVDACRQYGLGVDDFPYKKSGLYPYFERFTMGDYRGVNNPSARVDKAISDGVLYAKTAPQPTRQAIEQATPAIVESYNRIQRLIDTGRAAYNTRHLLLANLYSLALLGRLAQFKDEYYQENDSVHISEFNKRIAQEVADEPAPFIYERIGSRYYNYLIDEFQDTSRLQWLNFLPLLDEAMSHRFSVDTAAPGMQSLVVGDGKQAIYRFRQGDVRQFMRLPQVESPMHGASLQYNAQIVSLSDNYRTRSNIVEFNNRLFQWIVSQRFGDNPELVSLYLGHNPETGNRNPESEIRNSKSEGVPSLWQHPVKPGGYVRIDFSNRDTLFANILNTIRHQVDDLGYRYGDIMVLARDNKTLVAISNYLVANSVDNPIPIVSNESFILSNSRVVLLLQALLRCIFDPGDRVAAVQALRLAVDTGCLAESYDTLLWQLRSCRFDLSNVLTAAGIDFNVQRLRAHSLYDCCELLLRLFPLSGKDDAYVATFLDQVAAYTQHHADNLGDFLDFFEQHIDTISTASASDVQAVRLLTIHKAKGLEAPIVICAQPSTRPHPTKLWVRMDKQTDGMQLPVAYINMQKNETLFDDDFQQETRLSDMDRINLLYVALTRPREKLFVLCEQAATAGGTDNISLLYDFAQSESFQTSESSVVAAGGPDDRTTDGQHFSIGEDLRRPDSQSVRPSEGPVVHTAGVQSFEWQTRVSIAAQSAALLSPLEDDSRRYGILVHDLLSHIRTRDDVDPVVSRCCTDHRLGDVVADQIRSRILNTIDDPRNSHLFDPRNRVVCEMPLVINGQLRRPDRVVFANGVTWVVDFKTGAYSEQSHSQYQRQVAEYVAAISAMGYPDVRPVILYL